MTFFGVQSKCLVCPYFGAFDTGIKLFLPAVSRIFCDFLAILYSLFPQYLCSKLPSRVELWRACV